MSGRGLEIDMVTVEPLQKIARSQVSRQSMNSGVMLDPYAALVTGKRSGVVTRAAEPRTITHGDRIDGFAASLL